MTQSNPAFIAIDRAELTIVTGGLSSTIRTRKGPPEAQAAQSSGVDAKLSGVLNALQGVGKPTQQPAAAAPPQAAPSPFAGMMGV